MIQAYHSFQLFVGCDGEWFFHCTVSVSGKIVASTRTLVLQENRSDGKEFKLKHCLCLKHLHTLMISYLIMNNNCLILSLGTDLLLLLQEYRFWSHTLLLWGLCWLFWANYLWWLVFSFLQCNTHLIARPFSWSFWAGCIFRRLFGGKFSFKCKTMPYLFRKLIIDIVIPSFNHFLDVYSSSCGLIQDPR